MKKKPAVRRKADPKKALAERRADALNRLCNPDKAVRKQIIAEYMGDPELHTRESRAVMARFEEVQAFRYSLSRRTRSWLDVVWISKDLLVNVEGDVGLSGFTGPALPFAFGEVGSFDARSKGLTTLKGVPRRVRDSFDVSNNPFSLIEEWPDFVGGRGVMRSCPEVQSLPDEMQTSNLQIIDCPSLVSMGKHLSFTGNFELENCPALASPPEKLTVSGNLSIKGCPLTHLPAGLTVGGDLVLDDCPQLQALPADLTVHGKLSVIGCGELTTVGPGTAIKGNFEIEDCPALSVVPADLQVGGVLRFTRCSSLLSLPEGLACDPIEVHFCAGLATLPKTLQGLRSLLMQHGTALRSLPEHIKGKLHLEACPELESLPEVSVIDGDLIIEDAPLLRSLPETLTRVANLELRDCPRLTSLPPRLVIDQKLTLVNCPALTSLPPGLKVGGERRLTEWGLAPDDQAEEPSEEEDEDAIVSSDSFKKLRTTLASTLKKMLKPASRKKGNHKVFAHSVDAIKKALDKLQSDLQSAVAAFEGQLGGVEHQKSVESTVNSWATRPAENPAGASPARKLLLGEKRELLRLLKETRILRTSEKTDTHEYGSQWDWSCSFSIGDFHASSTWMYECHPDGDLEQEQLRISSDGGFSLEKTRDQLKTSLSLETLAIFLRFVAFRAETPGRHSRFEGEEWEEGEPGEWMTYLS